MGLRGTECRGRAALFPTLVRPLWHTARVVAGTIGTGWTGGWSSRRAPNMGGRSRENERRQVAWSREGCGGDLGDSNADVIVADHNFFQSAMLTSSLLITASSNRNADVITVDHSLLSADHADVIVADSRSSLLLNNLLYADVTVSSTEPRQQPHIFFNRYADVTVSDLAQQQPQQ
ncbi:hypothetical protein F511_40314 [Dorcoceras hygrometricum]|uniref:Uncharacterized protein n=1 Tax=Dorcoceras hygrometricum TaxID=472368 RepID=A0A2Z7D044_9LAMI|nr:hypothetical protein F511_40314 [Dorcoceras hygrometricum]